MHSEAVFSVVSPNRITSIRIIFHSCKYLYVYFLIIPNETLSQYLSYNTSMNTNINRLINLAARSQATANKLNAIGAPSTFYTQAAQLYTSLAIKLIKSHNITTGA